MYLSDMLKGGQTISAPARNEAIAANSLVQLGGYASNVGLTPVTNADNAAVSSEGTAVVASTVVNAFWRSSSIDKLPCTISSVDGSAYMLTNYAASSLGLSIFQYSSAGALLNSVNMNTASTVSDFGIVQLSNGNLAILYFVDVSPYQYYFTILDLNLNTVVAPTLIGVGVAPGYSSFRSLSGGGFAVAYSVSTGINLAIYSNTGAQVYAPTLISGTAAGAFPAVAQLSDGNVIVTVMNTTAVTANFAIFSPTGSVVAALTAFASPTIMSGGSTSWISVSALAGYFCVVVPGYSGTAYVAVFGNAGTLVGSAYNAPSGTGSLGYITNDGTNFWLLIDSGTTLYKIPTTGASNYTAFNAPAGLGGLMPVYDPSGFLILHFSTNSTFAAVDISGAKPIFSTALTALAYENNYALPSGDFAAFIFGQSASGTAAFMKLKYSNSAIMGVSQQTLAANNTGTQVSLSHGGGNGKNGYPMSNIVGTVGKSFDHSAATIIGNKGTLYNSSVVLEGIV